MCLNIVLAGGCTSARNPEPVGLTVMNMNGQVLAVSGLICYAPKATNAQLSSRDKVQVRHLLRQGCINAIVQRIETIARTGFSCYLPVGDALRIFHCSPFLVTMQLDSKETYATPASARSGAAPGADCETAGLFSALRARTTSARFASYGLQQMPPP